MCIRDSLESMEIGELVVLALETLIAGFCMRILSVPVSYTHLDVYKRQDGYATVKNLPLGRYYVKEKNAPDTYVLNTVPENVEFAYADQDTAVIEKEISVTDVYKRQAYDHRYEHEASKGTVKLERESNSSKKIIDAVEDLYLRIPLFRTAKE